jgi:ABC-type polysaccharide/polyol phosphate export permease
MIPEQFRIILYLNPVAGIFTSIQRIFVFGQWPVTDMFVAATAWALGIFFAGVLFFKSQARDLVERV